MADWVLERQDWLNVALLGKSTWQIINEGRKSWTSILQHKYLQHKYEDVYLAIIS
jgi:hypothetical protein